MHSSTKSLLGNRSWHWRYQLAESIFSLAHGRKRQSKDTGEKQIRLMDQEHCTNLNNGQIPKWKYKENDQSRNSQFGEKTIQWCCSKPLLNDLVLTIMDHWTLHVLPAIQRDKDKYLDGKVSQQFKYLESRDGCPQSLSPPPSLRPRSILSSVFFYVHMSHTHKHTAWHNSDDISFFSIKYYYVCIHERHQQNERLTIAKHHKDKMWLKIPLPLYWKTGNNSKNS